MTTMTTVTMGGDGGGGVIEETVVSIESVITSSFYSYPIPSFNEAKDFLALAETPYYKYIFLIKSAFFDLFHTALSLSLHLLLTFMKLILIAYPTAKATFVAIVEYHRSEFGLREYVIEFIIFMLLVLWRLYGREIKRVYELSIKQLNDKSRLAAMYIPITFYLTACILFTIMGSKIIVPLISPSRLPIITVLIPLFHILWSLQVKSKESVLVSLRLWCIIGTFHGLHMAIDTIPFALRIVRLLGLDKSYVSVFGIVVLMSVQLNSSIASLVLNSFFNPVISYIERYVPTTSSAKTEGLIQAILQPLRFMNIVSKETIDMISTFSRDFIISVIALSSILMAYPLVNIGLLMIAFFIPVNRSSTFIIQKTESLTAKRVDHIEQSVFWLRYWLLVSVWLFWDQVISNISNNFLFIRLSILYFTWLQHEYFKGSEKILSFVMDIKKSLKTTSSSSSSGSFAAEASVCSNGDLRDRERVD